MNIATNERARVPFALIGVVILLASTGYAVTLGSHHHPPHRGESTAALRETTAAARSAIHGAVRRAGAAAARNPVLSPANTSYGRVLDNDIPFRSAVRVRIAVQIRDALETVGDQTGRVRTEVVLPPISEPADLMAAVHNISINRGNTTAPSFHVTIQNLKLVASRNGQPIATERIDMTVQVASPVFVLHDRVTSFATRLNQSPFNAGFARQFTARVYAIAWARAYAQYAGVPIQNVIANRHLEIAANGAILAIQNRVFGTADQNGTAAYHRALLQTGARDLLTAADISVGRWTESILSHRGPDPPDPGPLVDEATATRPPLHAGIDRAADDAYATLLTKNSSPSIDALIDDLFTATAWIDTTQTHRHTRRDPAPTPAGWTLQDSRINTTSIRVADAQTTTDESSSPNYTVDTVRREVTVVKTVTKTWDRGDQTRTTTGTITNTTTIELTILAHLGTSTTTQSRLTTTARTSILSNLTTQFRTQLLTNRGGISTLMRKAVRSSINESTITVDIPIPSHTRDRIHRKVTTLRETLHNETIQIDPATVPRGDLAHHLERTIQNKSREWLTAQPPFDSLTAKAAHVIREQYLATVIDHLNTQGTARQSVLTKLGTLLEDAGVSPRHLNAVSGFLNTTIPGSTPTNSSTRVVGVPAYLTRAALTNQTIPGIDAPVYPLATRNVNLVSVPYGDVASSITDIVGSDTGDARLETAARALRIANQTFVNRSINVSVNRGPLIQSLMNEVSLIRLSLTKVLHRHTTLPRHTATTIVNTAINRYGSLDRRVSAATNGSLATTITHILQNRTTLPNRRVEQISVRVRRQLRTTVTNASIPATVLEGVIESTKGVARRTLERTVTDVLDEAHQAARQRWLGDALAVAPGGVPVVPVPGLWYATANAWRVQLRGGYTRFGVSVPVDGPLDGVRGRLTYVRENTSIRIDVDGDGDTELLGTNTPVEFSVDTAVIIVVPPGGGGVADIDGVRDERSPGWNQTTTAK